MSESLTFKWVKHLTKILESGSPRKPRGKLVFQLLNQQIVYNAVSPIIVDQVRDLNYRFMMAEALWILNGDDKVSGIVPWNKAIAEFSDNGESFFGAYGPKVMEQMSYVVNAINVDPDTRQAVINIWRESPPKTKDVPCTINMVFYVEHGTNSPDPDIVFAPVPKLSVTVNMRSSDAWLGVPYDVFNFAMVLLYVAARTGYPAGKVTLNMVNAHVYQENVESAIKVIENYVSTGYMVGDAAAPIHPSKCTKGPAPIINLLTECRDTKNKAECLAKWNLLNTPLVAQR